MESIDNYRDKGDLFRDNKKWEDAAESYRIYLESRADDWSIRVQYGHCLKESGNFPAALKNYRIAEKESRNDFDLKIHIGHLLKEMREWDAAGQSFASAILLQPDNREAQENLLYVWSKVKENSSSLGENYFFPTSILFDTSENYADFNKSTIELKKKIYIDLTDLFIYFKHSRNPTGIQRVQIEIAKEILCFDGDKEVCFFDSNVNFWKFLSPSGFAELYKILNIEENSYSKNTDENKISRFIESNKYNSAFEDGVLLNLGTAWGDQYYHAEILILKSKKNISYIQYVHDCIPIIYPNFCAQGVPESYSKWFSSTAFVADGYITNSKNTAKDFIRLQKRFHGNFNQRVEPVPLNANMKLRKNSSTEKFNKKSFIGGDYVLFVSTIEPRKDHAFVLDAWKIFQEEFIRDQNLLLVIIGKKGWNIGESLDFIYNHEALTSTIKTMHDISDQDLSQLYENCLYTIYNSHYEGWGLPVSEALSYNKIPVLPRHSSLVEAGGSAAVFFDHNNNESLVEALIKAYKLAKSPKDETHYKIFQNSVRSWKSISEDILKKVYSIVSDVNEISSKFFPLGKKLYISNSHQAQPNYGDVISNSCLIAGGWYPSEKWGTWTKFPMSNILLPVERDYIDTKDYLIYFNVLGVKRAAKLYIYVNIIGSSENYESDFCVDSGRNTICVVPFSIESKSLKNFIYISISSEEPYDLSADNQEDQRITSGAVISLLVARADDINSRMAVSEGRVFTEARRIII